MDAQALVDSLLQEAGDMQEGTPVALTLTSSEMVIEQIQIREDFKTKLMAAKNQLADEEDRIGSLKRVVGLLSRNTSTDVAKLEAYKWTLIRGEKEATRDYRP